MKFKSFTHSLFMLLGIQVLTGAPAMAQTKVLIVEPVPFLATVDSDLHNRLCLRDYFNNTNTSRRTSEMPQCGGQMQLIQLPAIGSMPARTGSLYLGHKNYPDLEKTKLQAMLISALAKDVSLRIIDPKIAARTSAKRVKLSPGEIGPFVVRASLTEINLDAERKSGGFGGAFGPLALLSTKKKAITGFARFDMLVIDSRDSSVVSAVPSSGSHEFSYVSETFFGGVKSGVERANSHFVIASAAREALEEGARLVSKELRAYAPR